MSFSKPFRLDSTAKGGGSLLYIREDKPCRYIIQITLNNSLRVFFKLDLRSKEWLLGCSYNHQKENITSQSKCCFGQALYRLWKYNSTRWF